MTTLRDVRAITETLWPPSGTEEWDRPGLSTGDLDQDVHRVLLAVDPVDATVSEAIERGADLLITHHPLLLRGVTTIASETYKGELLCRFIRADCAHLSVHTNADVVPDGVSDVIAKRLGLEDATPLIETGESEAETGNRQGIGRYGRLPVPKTLGELAEELAALLPETAQGIQVSGDVDAVITTVSLCGGAGDSLLGNELVRNSDVFITADLRHHPASEFREQARLHGGRPSLIGVSHWASESLWLDTAAAQLAALLPDIEFAVSTVNTDVWNTVFHKHDLRQRHGVDQPTDRKQA